MILLVDIGNSNIKWCFSNGVDIYNIRSFHYSSESVTKLLTSNLLNEDYLSDIDHVFVCCVAGKNIKSIFSDWVKTNLLNPPIYIESTNNELGVQNAYHETTNLGNDRWLSLLYGHHAYKTDVCIIDCGTAITIDIVLKNGQHEGGLIAPGYLTLTTALQQNTFIENNQGFVNQKNRSILQNNTHQCIEQGCRVMCLGYIKDVVEQLKNQYGDTLKIVITGGDGESLFTDLPEGWYLSPNLLFLSLQYYAHAIFDTNTKSELR